MDENDWLAERFEQQRTQLRAVAYRMLGSLAEADDAVQDAWLRVCRAETNDIENFGGWLTTIVARVCLNMLRTRNNRREERLEVHLPDPVISPMGELGPEDEALLADSVGLALLVVLDALLPLSAWPSFSMTCSTCHSRRSLRWSIDPRRRPGNSRAGRDVG